MINNRIFGTFTPLTRSQLKQNACIIATNALPVIVLAIGVIISVRTGIIIIAPVIAAISIPFLIYISRSTKFTYTRRFGMQYDLVRFVIGGFIVYQRTAWRGLLGLYSHLHFTTGYLNMSATHFGMAILMFSLLLFIVSNIWLNYVSDVQIADLLGFAEVCGATFAIGATFLLLLYT